MSKPQTTAFVANAASAGILESLAQHFAQQPALGQAKHLRLRNAILAAIRDGVLGPGDQVPPEQDLSAAVQLSLGTVQRTLRELAQEGTLLREHGRGTFVAYPGLPMDAIWQFRFRSSPSARRQPVSSKVIDQATIAETGRWSDALGPDAAGYLRFTRIIQVMNGPACFNELYLCASRFPGLSLAGAEDLTNINIKMLLAQDYNAPTLAVEQIARPARISARASEVLQCADDIHGMDVDVVGFSYGREPITLQRIWVPPTEFYMDFTYEESDFIKAGGAGVAKHGVRSLNFSDAADLSTVQRKK